MPVWNLHYLFGNHEDRIQRWWEDNVLFSGVGDLTVEYAGFVDSFTPYRHVLELSGLLFTHVPFNAVRAMSGVHATYKASQMARTHIVYGHSHKLTVQGTGRVGTDDSVYAYNVGCFFDKACDPQYMDGRIKGYWRGIAVFDLDEDNPLDPVSEVRFIKLPEAAV